MFNRGTGASPVILNPYNGHPARSPSYSDLRNLRHQRHLRSTLLPFFDRLNPPRYPLPPHLTPASLPLPPRFSPGFSTPTPTEKSSTHSRRNTYAKSL